MISVSEAVDLIRANFLNFSLKEEDISALERKVLARDVVAERDQPPFNRVAMDGIAVAWDGSRRSFPIQGIQRAGEAVKKLQNTSSAFEVMTGAPLPIGTDTVIPYEVVRIDNETAEVDSELKVKHGQNIHFKGSDYKEGEVVLDKGSEVTAPGVAVIASQGLVRVAVQDYPKIAVISTGDELVAPACEVIEEHQIRRSNPYAIASELKAFGIPEDKITLFHLNDDRAQIYESLKGLLGQYQVLILSGGVSKGKFDYIPGLMGDLNITTHFHKIKQRPGKPMLFGTGETGQLIFGLPGNPVSALICLRRYVIEVFREELGRNRSGTPHAKLATEVKFNRPMTFFLPVKVHYGSDGSIHATPVKGNGSGDFSSLAESDGFIELAAEKTVFAQGEAYPLYLWEGK